MKNIVQNLVKQYGGTCVDDRLKLQRISWVRFEMESKIQAEVIEVRPMKMETRSCSDVPSTRKSSITLSFACCHLS